MRLLLGLILMFGILGLADATRLTDDEFHKEFEAAYEQAQLCVADIKFGNTIPIPDPYLKSQLVKAVDVRCTNTFIGLYNMNKTPNQLEDYIGTDEVRKNKFETMKIGIALFVEVTKKVGTDQFPQFQKIWNIITNPTKSKPPVI